MRTTIHSVVESEVAKNRKTRMNTVAGLFTLTCGACNELIK